ncbi:C25 family cysteine peptidase [Prosthecodimorpha staleyi]|uniref:Gingipain domain-containing protein n=1 Tax=Prosthecodimorpha staleyi TaxID=2840188 RepID=A0A947GDD3_9HYPH|nr:C25 family cysteine peptidase [Prosthecodimorpha staleyi]MBT9290166.1 hypothetical protein [Prosthecodimorpha staleyi]
MKLIIRNRTASVEKYGEDGLRRLDESLANLIAADAARGIETRIVDVDDARQMADISSPPVTLRQSAQQLKAAIDGLDKALNPDFFVLLDGPDILPHVDLRMPKGLHEDPDPNIPSDLPYACSAPYSPYPTRYGAVTRVVGRLPAPPADHDSLGFMLRQIDRLVRHKPAARSDFAVPFALTAKVWDVSTRLSIEKVFGSDREVLVSPPSGPSGLDVALGRLPHFINCHGADSDVQFYGQDDASMPVALTSTGLAGPVRAGTVAVAECCYGAQLFDPDLTGGTLPIALTYLDQGAVGFLGSTNIAYGPADSNGQADVLTHLFMAGVRRGLTLGRALLEARQEFVRSQSLANPTNLKTLAQFVLLGDPSIQACAEAVRRTDLAFAMPELQGLNVKSRAVLKASGIAAAGQALYLTGKEIDGNFHLRFDDALDRIAGRYGFSKVKPRVLDVRGGAVLGRQLKARMETRANVVYCQRIEGAGKSVRIRVLNVAVANDRLVKIELSESR